MKIYLFLFFLLLIFINNNIIELKHINIKISSGILWIWYPSIISLYKLWLVDENLNNKDNIKLTYIINNIKINQYDENNLLNKPLLY